MNKLKLNAEILTQDIEYVKETWNIEITPELLELREKFQKLQSFIEKLECRFAYYYKYEFTFDIIYRNTNIGQFTIGGTAEDIYKFEVDPDRAPFEHYFWWDYLQDDDLKKFIESFDGRKTIYFKDSWIQKIEFYINCMEIM